MKRWRIHDLKLDLETLEDEGLTRAASQRLGIPPRAIQRLLIVKKSFDARKRRPAFVYIVDVEISKKIRIRPRGKVEPAPIAPQLVFPKAKQQERIAVIGAGPAGLFAALTLARAGLKPIIIDRGKPVETRGKDVGALMNRGILDPESNLCFGEGGAGTWSDGKLTTRINAPQLRFVLETLHEMGGPARILTDGKPHLGTDKLVKILKEFRKVLIQIGAEFRYGTRVDDLIVENRRVVGLSFEGGGKERFDRIILATGHSSQNIYESLLRAGVHLRPKPFAVGFRIEHPQALINKIQYGDFAEHPALPAADYRLTAKVKTDIQRGVYSFCMCPGGQIMPTTTQPEKVVVNGMSNASRSGRWANSALVVTVNPKDFARHGEGVLAGAALQHAAEAKAYALGGGAFRAPGQKVTDFLARRASTELRKTTYRPGVTPCALDSLFDAPIIEALREALVHFGKRMPGFLTEDAILHGVETRTSAPVSIVRGDNLQSVNTQMLYPTGEGAGYAGGIVSAAMDGLRVANQIVEELSA